MKSAGILPSLAGLTWAIRLRLPPLYLAPYSLALVHMRPR